MDPIPWAGQRFDVQAFVRFVGVANFVFNPDVLRGELVLADQAHPWVMKTPGGAPLPSMRRSSMIPSTAREPSEGDSRIMVEVKIFTIEPAMVLTSGQLPPYYNNLGRIVDVLRRRGIEGVAGVGLLCKITPAPFYLRSGSLGV